MLKRIFKKSTPADFQQLLRRADILVEERNSEGLKDLIKLVLRPIQSKHLLDAYVKGDHRAVNEIGLDNNLGFRSFITAEVDGRLVGDRTLTSWLFSDDCKITSEKPTLSLSSDIVLPTPWHPQSIIANLGKIGNGRQNGVFKQSTNHSVIYLYPLMIGLVNGGNHSIMQGILDGNGEIKPAEVYDISCLLSAVRFDGYDWLSELSGNRIGTPPYVEFGWVWEIAKRYSKVKSMETQLQ